MYKPTHCLTLDKSVDAQIRLGIQGYGGTGKTWSSLTFPNPIVANFDRGLRAHHGREDVIEAKFWDIEWCKLVNPNHKGPENLRDTAMSWLNKEAIKLERDQTLVWDGGTATQNFYHKWYANNKVYTAGGKVDDFAEYKLKLQFFAELCEIFQRLKCDVVYISHEADKKEKDGSYSGKLRPLLSGQFSDQIMNYFTDWFRQVTTVKKQVEKMDATFLKAWGFKSTQEAMDMYELFPNEAVYAWQTEGDEIFDGKCSSLVNFPKYIPADYKSFEKYKRKINFSVPVIEVTESSKATTKT